MFRYARKKEREDGSIDFEIERRFFKIELYRYYTVIEWIADVMIGCFFITGSILNFLDVPSLYSSICYLIGSLSMTVRPTIKVLRHIRIRRRKEGKR